MQNGDFSAVAEKFASHFYKCGVDKTEAIITSDLLTVLETTAAFEKSMDKYWDDAPKRADAYLT